jgi:hypothetical protein
MVAGASRSFELHHLARRRADAGAEGINLVCCSQSRMQRRSRRGSSMGKDTRPRPLHRRPERAGRISHTQFATIRPFGKEKVLPVIIRFSWFGTVKEAMTVWYDHATQKERSTLIHKAFDVWGWPLARWIMFRCMKCEQAHWFALHVGVPLVDAIDRVWRGIVLAAAVLALLAIRGLLFLPFFTFKEPKP